MTYLRYGIAICLALTMGCRTAPTLVPAEAVSARVRESVAEAFDRSRGRKIPIKIYEPEVMSGRLPLVIFSHGLGSSREGYRYLGRYWASRGYVVIHVQHPGSDNRLSWLGLYRAARAGDVAGNRPRDISSVIDALEGSERTGPQSSDLERLRERVDLRKIGLAGHSYGAYTVLAIAGLLIDFPDALDRSFRDRRVTAAIAISSPRIFGAPRREDYREIEVPLLHLTGTWDRTLVLRTFARDRRVPYEAIAGRQYLVTIDGARHSSFAQEPGDRAIEGGKRAIQKLTMEVTLRFWSAFLKGERGDREWIDGVRLQGATIERR